MIDTDKYEGHTVYCREQLGTFKGTDIFVWDWFAQQLPRWASKADFLLVADAPLLLAEVKRLNDYIESIFDGGMCDIETYEEYKERIE